MPRLQGHALASRKNRVGQGSSKREKGPREAALEELLAVLEGPFQSCSFWAPQPCWVGRQGSRGQLLPTPNIRQEEAGRDGEQKAEPRAPGWAVLPEPGWD